MYHVLLIQINWQLIYTSKPNPTNTQMAYIDHGNWWIFNSIFISNLGWKMIRNTNKALMMFNRISYVNTIHFTYWLPYLHKYTSYTCMAREQIFCPDHTLKWDFHIKKNVIKQYKKENNCQQSKIINKKLSLFSKSFGNMTLFNGWKRFFLISMALPLFIFNDENYNGRAIYYIERNFVHFWKGHVAEFGERKETICYFLVYFSMKYVYLFNCVILV